MENYRDIPGYEGTYQVSDTGNVKIIKTGKLKKAYLVGTGYLQTELNNPKKKFKIHQLVAMAFLGHKPDGTQNVVVDHINGNKVDNRVENLQLTTTRHNTSKAVTRDLPTGVFKRMNWEKYTSQYWHDGKVHYLGSFSTVEEASIAYQNAISKL